MNDAQRAFLDAFDEREARGRAEIEKSEEALLRPLRLAEGRIEAAAQRMVEKSGEACSKDQAVARVLKTREGAVLYSDYLREQERVRGALEITDRGRVKRETLRDATNALITRIQKSVDLGEDVDDAIERELSDPRVAAEVGVPPIELIEKGANAWAQIEQAADRLVAKSDEVLTREQAVDRVLQQEPWRYAKYLYETGLE